MQRAVISIASFFLLFLSAPAPASPAGDVPFEKFAGEFVKARGLEQVPLDDAALSTALERGYVTARLGLFQVWYPAAELREKELAQRFQAAAEALVDLQDTWLDWAGDKETVRQAERESKILHAWIRTWKSLGAIRKEDREKEGPDLLLLLDAKDAVAGAAASYADRIAQSLAPDQDAEDCKDFMLILSPTRKDFLGLGSFIGSLNDENRRILWNDGLALWTSFRRAGINVIALEHPASYPGRGDITQGIGMDAKEATGMLQHVVQTSTQWMIERAYGDRMPPSMANGLAMYMVVVLFKENNVRAGGGAGGTSTAAYSRFVRGGSSTGGKLPAISADSLWRKKKGRDCFLDELREAQKKGADAALKKNGRKRDKRAFFILRSIDGTSDYAVEAPFLNGAAHREPVPDGYVDDFLEFHRAYRCAFTQWLVTKGKAAAGRTASRDLVRLLLNDLPRPAAGAEGPTFEGVVETVYGQPLTAGDGSAKSLEWAFLDWLSRGG